MLKINRLTKEQAAYIAGIMDGEGTLGLMRNHGSSAYRTPSFVLRLRIGMTHEQTIRWIHSVVGGRLYIIKPTGKMTKHQYAWSLAGKNALRFLRQIYPYLITKKAQADIAFEFGKTLHCVEFGDRLSDEIVIKRNELRDSMTILNGSRAQAAIANNIRRKES